MSLEHLKKKNTDVRLETLLAERNQVVQLHLNAISEENAEDAQTVNLITQAMLQGATAPEVLVAEASTEKLVSAIERVAYEITSRRRKREWERIKACLEANNARCANPVMLASAKRNGVELAPAAPPAVIVPDAPKLVQE